MVNQTTNWGNQSIRYVRDSEKNSNKKKSEKINFFKIFFKNFFKNKKIRNVLDVGCGNGDFLEDFEINKKIKKYGIETSVQTVKFLNKRHKKIKFKKAYCHKIPFNQDAFDLVIVWSVLHWIDRNNYLQSLGELIRVTNKYLIVMDFFPNRPHKTKYKHKKNFFTYKTDFDATLLSSGYLKKETELNYYINEKENKLVKITLKNQKEDYQRKMVIYKKKITLPLKSFK